MTHLLVHLSHHRTAFQRFDSGHLDVIRLFEKIRERMSSLCLIWSNRNSFRRRICNRNSINQNYAFECFVWMFNEWVWKHCIRQTDDFFICIYLSAVECADLNVPILWLRLNSMFALRTHYLFNGSFTDTLFMILIKILRTRSVLWWQEHSSASLAIWIRSKYTHGELEWFPICLCFDHSLNEVFRFILWKNKVSSKLALNEVKSFLNIHFFDTSIRLLSWILVLSTANLDK